MRQKTRKLLIALLSLVFVGSLGMLIYRGMDYKKGEETYAEAETLVELPDFSDLPAPVVEAETSGTETETAEEEPKQVYVDPYADALRNMDFTA